MMKAQMKVVPFSQNTLAASPSRCKPGRMHALCQVKGKQAASMYPAHHDSIMDLGKNEVEHAQSQGVFTVSPWTGLALYARVHVVCL